MDVTDAASLLAGAVRDLASEPAGPQVWADLGAGTGTFTLALASLLGPDATIFAVDRDRHALAELRRSAAAASSGATIAARVADFTDEASWRTLELPRLNGVLLANALHFVSVAEQATVLGRVAGDVRQGGVVVVVEYADRKPNRWVPHPVSPARLRTILPASLGAFREIGRRRSNYGGDIYAAMAERL